MKIPHFCIKKLNNYAKKNGRQSFNKRN